MNRPELLLVDDDPIAIEVLSHMLGGFARLRFARSGAEALRLAHEHRPDLMLLDAEMPGMSGLEVLEALQADSTGLSHLPVIVITSHRSADLEAEVFARGAVDFLPKPLSTAQVLSRIQTQLRLQRMAQHAERMPPSFPPQKDASLLVVDDDIGAIQTLQAALQDLVGRIRFATSGAQALELMLEAPPTWCCWMCRCRAWTASTCAAPWRQIPC
jgi:CheY-like chemotaxis protein